MLYSEYLHNLPVVQLQRTHIITYLNCVSKGSVCYALLSPIVWVDQKA